MPVRINGQITLEFLLDTGASEVTIPADVFLTLLRTHTVGQEDFIGTGRYVLADGSERASKRFRLREVRVGHHVLSDVVANVAPVQSEYPLLGQSFLSKFSSWSINNKSATLVLSDETDVAREPPKSPDLLSRTRDTLCGREVDYLLDRESATGASARFIGVWTGTWNNASRLCGALVVEKAGSDGTAEVVYIYGPSKPGSSLAWKRRRASGVIRPDGKLVFRDDQGSTFLFEMENPTVLNALFGGAAGRLMGQFAKMD